MPEERVSVVTIVRDGERYIETAILSIRQQTLRELEHVIIDDGSRDGTPEIIDRLAREDSRIRVIRQEPLGIPVARNLGISESHGEYMAVLDADDVAMPDRLEKQVAFMDAHPDVGMLGGGEFALDTKTGAVAEIRHPQEHEAIRLAWLYRQVFTHSATIMRRSVLDDVGGYDTEFSRGSDPELWARIAGRSRVVNLSDVMVVRRYHPDQLIRRKDLASVRLSLLIRIRAARHLRLPPWYYPLLVAPLLSGLPDRLKSLMRRAGRQRVPVSHSVLRPVDHLLEDVALQEGNEGRKG